MPKKLILVFVLIFLFSGVSLARAEVVINEFVSHPNTGEKEWVELFSTDLQNLTGWSLTDLASPGTETQHENSMKDLTGLIIPAGEVLVVEVSGLNDGGDSIGLYNGTSLIDRVTYGTSGTVSNYSINLVAPLVGKSGALISGVWETNQDPTKGEANAVVISPSPTPPASSSGGNPSSSVSGATTPETKIKITEEPKIKIQITTKTLGFVGFPLSFNATTYGLNGEQLRYGKYFWNFGDGDSKEVNLNSSQPFSHTYFYPGEYVVFLDYFSNPYILKEVPDASNQITIKIIGADISISRVGEEKDFFVELSNNTDYSADISNWFLVSAGKSFTIPRNTVLPTKKKMIISPKITNFSIADKDTLKLMNSEGEVVFDYAALVPPIIPVKITAVNSQEPNSQEPFLRKEELSLNSETEIPTDNLLASAISTEVAGNNPNNSYLPMLASIIFIGASASAVYFIRRKKVIPGEANDFEILDE